jgi:hypothetical protein
MGAIVCVGAGVDTGIGIGAMDGVDVGIGIPGIGAMVGAAATPRDATAKRAARTSGEASNEDLTRR